MTEGTTSTVDQQITDLLNGDPLPPDPQPEPEPQVDQIEAEQEDAQVDGGEGEEPEAPPKINYADEVKVPMPSGVDEEVTIGKLKDFYVDHVHATNRLQKQQAEVTRERAQVSALLNEVMPHIPEHAREAALRVHGERLKVEQQMLLRNRPEWQQATAFTADQGRMFALANQYGVSAEELQAVSDHRYVLMLDDFAKLREKVDGAERAKPKPAAQKPTPKRPDASEKQRQAMFDKARTSTDNRVKDAAVTELLKGIK